MLQIIRAPCFQKSCACVWILNLCEFKNTKIWCKMCGEHNN